MANTVYSGTLTWVTLQDGTSATVPVDTTINEVYIENNTLLYVDGGIINSANFIQCLNYASSLYGRLELINGGIVKHSEVCVGQITVSSGGIACNTSLSYGNDVYGTWIPGILVVSSGGTATQTTVGDIANMYVLSGGTATDIYD